MMALRRNYELAVSSDRFLEHNRVAKRASMFRSWRMATLRRRHIKQALANACKRLHRLQLSHVFSRMKRVVCWRSDATGPLTNASGCRLLTFGKRIAMRGNMPCYLAARF